jgi:hypothetical protein
MSKDLIKWSELSRKGIIVSYKEAIDATDH